MLFDIALKNTKTHRHIPVGFGKEEEYEKGYYFYVLIQR